MDDLLYMVPAEAENKFASEIRVKTSFMLQRDAVINLSTADRVLTTAVWYFRLPYWKHFTASKLGL